MKYMVVRGYRSSRQDGHVKKPGHGISSIGSAEKERRPRALRSCCTPAHAGKVPTATRKWPSCSAGSTPWSNEVGPSLLRVVGPPCGSITTGIWILEGGFTTLGQINFHRYPGWSDAAPHRLGPGHEGHSPGSEPTRQETK